MTFSKEGALSGHVIFAQITFWSFNIKGFLMLVPGEIRNPINTLQGVMDVVSSLSSLHYVVFLSFLLVFVQWSMFRHIELSVCDIIAFKKGSTGDGKFTFCRWG